MVIQENILVETYIVTTAIPIKNKENINTLFYSAPPNLSPLFCQTGAIPTKNKENILHYFPPLLRYYLFISFTKAIHS